MGRASRACSCKKTEGFDVIYGILGKCRIGDRLLDKGYEIDTDAMNAYDDASLGVLVNTGLARVLAPSPRADEIREGLEAIGYGEPS